MNYINITCHENDIDKYFYLMVDSINKHCDCEILLHTTNDFDLDLPDNVRVFDFPRNFLEGRRAYCRIERVQEVIYSDMLNEGDKVFVMNHDLILQDDVFKVFGNFDVAYTNRHYEDFSRVNSNVWAFEYNERSKEFVDFVIDQMKNPTWEPLLKFKEKATHEASSDYLADQDVMCAVYRNGHVVDFPCHIRDITYKYNFCPEVKAFNLNESIRQLKEVMGNKEYKVLNFKGKTRLLLDNE